jgi:hypothetical protein
LLLGFTFANGISHLDQRRVLIVQESNAIGTAYLRLDLLPANRQQEMRQLFRQYLDTRLDVYEKLPDLAAAGEDLQRARNFSRTSGRMPWRAAATIPPRTWPGYCCRR